MKHPSASSTPRSPRSVAAIALLSLAVGGCPTDPDSDPLNVQDPPGYTDPAAMINAHAQALTKQDYAKYEKLLTEDFEYHPQSEDLIDFPWLQGRVSWSRADELQMIGHMFDDDFHPADPTAGTVDTIDAQLTVDAQSTDTDGSRLVYARGVMTVMYAMSGSGARSDVRFEFRLVAGTDGFLRIRSIHERPPYQPAVEPTNWGTIKNLYR